tara:strand:+ start:449 stop:784 length:336 start_codon:yes stop_codon:yes gene_type:complete
MKKKKTRKKIKSKNMIDKIKPLDRSIIGGLAALALVETTVISHLEDVPLQIRLHIDSLYYCIGAQFGIAFSTIYDSVIKKRKILKEDYYPAYLNVLVPLVYTTTKMSSFQN